MHRFWKLVLQPLLEASPPRVIVEIGSGGGLLTRELLDFASGRDVVVHTIDPSPAFNVPAWEEEWGEHLVVHQARSLSVLSSLGPVDLALIDGDHNWYTVTNELTLLERSAKKAGSKREPPLIALHDVGWPYGRRDMYYDPESVPEAYRQPFKKRGLKPDETELTDGGLNDSLNNAVYENDLRNGVRTAIDDFVAKSRRKWEYVEVPGLHGLGVLVPAARLRRSTKLRTAVERLRSPEFLVELSQSLEAARTNAEIRGLRIRKDAQAATDLAERLEASSSQLQETLGKREEATRVEDEAERAKLHEAIAAAEQARGQAEERLVEAGEAVAASRVQLDQAVTAHEQEIAKARKRLQAAEAARAGDEGERLRLREALKAAEQARGKLEGKLADAGEAVAAGRTQLAAVEAASSKKEDELREIRRALAESGDERRILQHRLDGRGHDLDQAAKVHEQEIAKARNALMAAKQARGRLEDKLAGAGEREHAAKAVAAAREEESQKAEQQLVEKAERRLAEAEYGTRRLSRRLSERDAELSFLEAERAELLADVRRVAKSRAWRYGHALSKATRRLRFRTASGLSAIDVMLRRLGDETLREAATVPQAPQLGIGASAPTPRVKVRVDDPDEPISIGFIEPHLFSVGGIRRILESGNRLVGRGHRVTIYLPDGQDKSCDWMECAPDVKSFSEGTGDEIDVLIFNHEPHWYVLERFTGARFRVLLGLSYSRLYGKSGSWECLRYGVDLRLANSKWTADHIEEEIGVRPPVVPTGVDHDQFQPIETKKRYPILCAGDPRPWKGTDLIKEACTRLDLPVEVLHGKNLPQQDLAEAYRAAEVFVVGSPLDGFGQPGLEALSSGVPLVTTDNGGCREYAKDGETALIVPPGDVDAMAEAIRRVREDDGLRQHLIDNGLEMSQRFTWDEAAVGLEKELLDLVYGRTKALERPTDGKLRAREPKPVVSVITLTWNQIELTQRFVESIRQHTDLPYELIMVDNGSTKDDTAAYVSSAADVPIVNPDNLGFSAGFNQGLAAARGKYVFFVNNDTKLPAGWASRLISTIERDSKIGAVFPVVTYAPNPETMRSEPADNIEIVPPFKEPPSGIALVMRTSTARDLGGWGEEYMVASGEDTDFCFKIWVNDLTIVLDEAVLVDHVGKASAKQLEDWRERWITNRHIFLDKWAGPLDEVPRLDSCPEEAFEANKHLARAVAFWMRRYFRHKDKRPGTEVASAQGNGSNQGTHPRISGGAASSASSETAPFSDRQIEEPVRAPLSHRAARVARSGMRVLLPARVRAHYYRKHRERYARIFMDQQRRP